MENDGKNDGKNDANLTVGRIVFWVAIAILVAAAAAIFAFVPVRYLPWPSADISRTGNPKYPSDYIHGTGRNKIDAPVVHRRRPGGFRVRPYAKRLHHQQKRFKDEGIHQCKPARHQI